MQALSRRCIRSGAWPGSVRRAWRPVGAACPPTSLECERHEQPQQLHANSTQAQIVRRLLHLHQCFAHTVPCCAVQEPYRWPAVTETARTVLAMRYRLLPYLYTLLHSASSTGAPLMRPLWMNFPQDAATHKNSRWGVAPVVAPASSVVAPARERSRLAALGSRQACASPECPSFAACCARCHPSIHSHHLLTCQQPGPAPLAHSRQFMLGDAVLVTPVLEPSVDSVEGYFPQGLWYSLWPVVELTEDSLVDARWGAF